MQTISGFWGVMAYAIGAIFGNYFLIYLGALIVFAFSILPPFFIEENKTLTEDKQDTIVTEKKSKATQWGELLKLYFAHGFSWIGVQTMFVYIIAYIQQKLNPASETETGQIIAISFLVLNAVGFILPAFVLEPITEKVGRVKTHLTCVAIMAIGYFGIVLIGKTSIILYIFMAVCGIGWAAIVSLPFAIMSEKVDESRMGFFMGIFNLSVVIPQLIVSLVLGYFILEAQDKNLIFIISGTTLAISAVLWIFVKESKAAIAE
jgi:maltose/moltooligosaccharide transporter